MTMTMERPTSEWAGATTQTRRPMIAEATTDPSEDVREWELDAEGRHVWEAGYMVGYRTAEPQLVAEVERLKQLLEQAESDADRYYAEMCRRPAPAEPTRQSFSELSRIRGEHDRADRHDKRMAEMFPEYAAATSPGR